MQIKQVHFSVKMVKRSEGQSSVSKAAYRSGEKLYDERRGQTFDWTHKDDILHSEILAPDNSPEFVYDRNKLWNVVEKEERQKNAQPARDITAALPRELSLEQNKELVRKFVKENFVSRGMIADFSIHESEASDGGKNPHVHLLLTMKEITEDGFKKTKNRDWNKKSLLKDWREQWTNIINDALDEADALVRFDHRTLEAQGIDREPTFHLGIQASNMEDKGIETDKGNRLRHVVHLNKAMETAKAVALWVADRPRAVYERYRQYTQYMANQREGIMQTTPVIDIEERGR